MEQAKRECYQPWLALGQCHKYAGTQVMCQSLWLAGSFDADGASAVEGTRSALENPFAPKASHSKRMSAKFFTETSSQPAVPTNTTELVSLVAFLLSTHL
jgi:hypothetical protein